MTWYHRACALLAPAFAAIALAACTRASASPDSGGERELKTHRGTFVATMTLTGQLKAADASTVTVPRLPSWQTTVRWLIPDGTEVKAGDKVAELDDGEVASSMESKRSALEQAQHALEEKRADVRADLAEKGFELEKKRSALEKARIAASVPEDLYSRRDYQDLQLRLAAATSEFEKARETYDAAKKASAAELRNLEIARERAAMQLQLGQDALKAIVLRAPRDGIAIVQELYWEERKIRAGDAVFVGMPIVTIPVMESIEISADLWDVDDGRIRAGQRAVATMDAWPDERFTARVRVVSGVAKERGEQSLRRAFEVIAALDRIDTERMRPGYSVRLDVTTERRPGVVLVPREAIRAGDTQAYVTLRDGKEQPIVLGPCNARECVAESGIDAEVRLARPGRRRA